LIFFGGEFTKNTLCCKFLVFSKKNPQKMKKLHKKIAIIAHTMEGCLRFDTFIFQTLPNLAKYIYMGCHHLSNITKLKRKTPIPMWCSPFFFKEKSCG
jgi:hypothetical protein